MIEMIVFDMAGTTVDEGNVVYKTLMHSVNAAGCSYRLPEVLAAAAGKEKRDAIASLMAVQLGQAVSEKQVDAVFADFKQALGRAYANLQVQPIPGATAFLQGLRKNGVKVVLNTGYNQATAQSLLDKMGWQAGREYDLLVTADQVRNARPAPDMIALAQQKLGVPDASKVVKVGDSAIDIEEGKNAGCGHTVGVTTGAQTAAQIGKAQPDFIIDSLSEIEAKLPL